jgi:hypothetical protein
MNAFRWRPQYNCSQWRLSYGYCSCACLDRCLYSLQSPWKMLVGCSYPWKPLLIPLTWKPLLNLCLHGNALCT